MMSFLSYSGLATQQPAVSAGVHSANNTSTPNVRFVAPHSPNNALRVYCWTGKSEQLFPSGVPMSAKSYARRLERRAKSRKLAAGELSETEAAEFKKELEAFEKKNPKQAKK
jgi:hypothetical protein